MKKVLILLSLTIFLFTDAQAQLGTIDANFTLGTGFTGTGFTQSRVECITQQADGKLLVGGWFTDYNGTSANRIARLNLDGSIDNSFKTGAGFTGFSGYVKSIALQQDGKIVVGGNFTAFNGTTRHRIARLNSDGSLDTSFDPLTGFNSDVNSVAIQSDGKIVVAGVFSSFDWQNSGGISRLRIARLYSDGSLDASFDPGNGFVSTTGAQARVHKLIIQSDGKILACGQFEEFNTSSRIIVARLNSDGTLDNSFDAGRNFQLNFGFYGEAWDMKLQPNGKILLAGNFGHTGASNSGVIRLNSDGSLDNTFTINKKATAIGLQSNGQVYVSETGPYNFNRHNTDGTIDPSFPQTTFNDIAQTIVIQSDGNILIGGWFSYNPSGLMRLIGDNPNLSTSDLLSNPISVLVYPNPTSQYINIEIGAKQIEAKIDFALLSLNGQKLMQTSIDKPQYSFDVQQLPSGLYIYHIVSNFGILKTGKVVIE